MPRAKPSAPAAAEPAAPPADLREACVSAAREVIAEQGIENLSLRDVARKLGVSHQAPYKHYPSRDHLLAEVMRRCFEEFAAWLDARKHFDDPAQDLESLGHQYLHFAQQRPLEYRLMFSTPWPAAAHHPEVDRYAVHAFDVLRQVMQRMHGTGREQRERVELDALYIWSSMHGLAGVMIGDSLGKLGLGAKVRKQLVTHIMTRVGHGLAGPV